MGLRILFVSLVVIGGIGAGTASAGTVCTGDVCVITGGFQGLQADISTSGAPAAVTRLLSNEETLAQRLHPPGPCFVGNLHPPSPCLPDSRYFASAAVLVLVDAEVRLLGGFTAFGCPGGCSFPPAAARLIDGDIQTMLAGPQHVPARWTFAARVPARPAELANGESRPRPASRASSRSARLVQSRSHGDP